MARIAALFALLACLGCGTGTPFPVPGPPDDPPQIAPLLLTAGLVVVPPAPEEEISASVTLGRFGILAVHAAYELTTPAGDPFEFDLLCRNEANSGAVRVSLAHVADDGWPPLFGVESLAAVGLVISAPGATADGDWFHAVGDGLSRITVRGSIDREQILAVEAQADGATACALIRLGIGARSIINVSGHPPIEYPGVVRDGTLYSSNTWKFGMPAIAVSGDRSSIVVYEGDPWNPDNPTRYEMRLQYDHETEAVTGGGAVALGPDSGNWRDHAIAALHNVIALVRAGTESVTFKISFDRGATFGQTAVLEQGTPGYMTRLARVAIAADYSLAVVYWSGGELRLREGSPSAFDGEGSPAEYEFGPTAVLFRHADEILPAVVGAAYSDAGDLVIGYGFTRIEFDLATMTWSTYTEFRSAVRHYGGWFVDNLVEENVVVSKDPSVSIVGQGGGMRIFYAYEAEDGVRLRTSSDQGRSWSEPAIVGDGTAHLPGVFARFQDCVTRVDLLYLVAGEEGRELRLCHWDDYDSSSPTDFRLTVARMIASESLPAGTSVPGTIDSDAPPPAHGFRITQVAWFGYDAVLDGDDLLLVFDEETFDAEVALLGAPSGAPPVPRSPSAAGDFQPADPPPLAPGMTMPMPRPSARHMHQLRWLRLD